MSEIERLRAENAALKARLALAEKVVKAARKASNHCTHMDAALAAYDKASEGA